MKEPWEWQEDEILALIREQRAEDLMLEYKRSDALSKEDEKKKTDISKDVSAMANSAGGAIVYGLDEQKKTNGPLRLDGIDPRSISREWLEQVIDSRIQRRISNLRVHQIDMSGTSQCVYVVSIPQSNLAPHMASDHRYYKRLGTTTASMEEYEVRDVGRRSESPDLSIDFRVGLAGSGTIRLSPRIINRSAEPVFYASIRLYCEEPLDLQANAQWSYIDRSEMIWNERYKLWFKGLRSNWSVPERHPILEGEYYDLYHVNLGYGAVPREIQRWNIGWEVRAPKASPKLCGVRLTLDPSTGPRIEPYKYSLAIP